MSYALASKKRKFHRVLDSISLGSSQKPTSSKPAAAEGGKPISTGLTQPNSSIKRVRRSQGDDLNEPSVIPSSGNISRYTAPSTISLRPSFVPWDRQRFLERLETFRSVERWKPQPDAINEVQWAKRGWSCTDKSRVECSGGCGHAVVIRLPEDIDDLEDYDAEAIADRKEVRAQLVTKYLNLIVEGHDEKCPWRKSGCDDSIQRLPLSKPEEALHNLRKRYVDLSSMGSRLPPMESIVLPGTFDIDAILASLPPGALNNRETPNSRSGETDVSEDTPATEQVETIEEQPPAAIDKAAFALAFFGWDVSGEASAGLAGCKACFRRLGLWMYKQKEDGGSALYSELDVIREHLDYCPWISAEAQSGKKPGPCGWEALKRVIESENRRQLWSTNGTSQSTQETLRLAGATIPEPADEETRKSKDREWWAKLRRVRQVLHSKGAKK